MKSPNERTSKRRRVMPQQCCTPKPAPWSKVCKRMEPGVLAKMWPATHVIMGLHVAKQVRQALQAHAERVKVGSHITKSWAKQSARALAEGADDDEFTQRSAQGLSQFRYRGVEIDIGGRLFLTEVCRAVFTAYELGWEGQIVSFDVSHFCGPFSVKADLMAVRLLQVCKGLRKVTLAHNKGMQPVADMGLPMIAHNTGLPMQYRALRRLTLDDISSVIASHPSLADVNVRSEPYMCRLSSTEAAKLVSSFACCPHLQHLNLTGFYFAVEGCASLAKAIELCPELVTLNLGNNKLDPRGLHPCLIGAGFCRHLEHLDLYGTKLSDDGFQQLAENITLRWENFKSLNLRGIRLDAEKAALLARALQHRPSLEYLDIRATRIPDTGVGALARVLPNLPHLAHLDVSKNAIGRTPLAGLCSALIGCKRLVYLNVSFNGVSSEGGEALASLLPHLPSLQYLNLFHTCLGDAGAGCLANVAAECPKLRYIDLRQNAISNLGAALLGNLVQHCPCLTTLDLSKDLLSTKDRRFRGVTKPRSNPSGRFSQDRHLEESGVELLAASFGSCGCRTGERQAWAGTHCSRRKLVRECWRVVWSAPGRKDVVQVRTCQGAWSVEASQWKQMRLQLQPARSLPTSA